MRRETLLQPREERQLIERVEQEIYELDRAIKRHALFLDMIQPFAQGKISCRIMSRRGGQLAEPTFVQWKWTASTRKEGKLRYYDILSTEQAARFIKHYGPFNGTQGDVRSLIVAIRNLMVRRKALTQILGRFSHSIKDSLRASTRALEAQNELLQQEAAGFYERHRDRIDAYRREIAARASEQEAADAQSVLPEPEYEELLNFPAVTEEEMEELPGVLPEPFYDADGNEIEL